jgi:ferritin-like metal-binding protein YciE
MNRLNSLEELYVDLLRDLYSTEVQMVEALARMSEAATSVELKAAFAEHLDGTVDHLNRVEEVFKTLGKSPRGKHCSAVEGLVNECRELINADIAPDVLDAALIAVAQKAEHYEIAGYGTLRAYAILFGNEKSEAAFWATLEEEKEFDRKLTDIAIRSINREAREGAMAG